MEEIQRLSEFANSNSGLWTFGIAALTVGWGWISPFISERQNFKVVERANSVQQAINNRQFVGEKAMSEKINRFILNITRLAFVHQSRHREGMHKK